MATRVKLRVVGAAGYTIHFCTKPEVASAVSSVPVGAEDDPVILRTMLARSWACSHANNVAAVAPHNPGFQTAIATCADG